MRGYGNPADTVLYVKRMNASPTYKLQYHKIGHSCGEEQLADKNEVAINDLEPNLNAFNLLEEPVAD